MLIIAVSICYTLLLQGQLIPLLLAKQTELHRVCRLWVVFGSDLRLVFQSPSPIVWTGTWWGLKIYRSVPSLSVISGCPLAGVLMTWRHKMKHSTFTFIQDGVLHWLKLINGYSLFATILVFLFTKLVVCHDMKPNNNREKLLCIIKAQKIMTEKIWFASRHHWQQLWWVLTVKTVLRPICWQNYFQMPHSKTKSFYNLNQMKSQNLWSAWIFHSFLSNSGHLQNCH